MKAFWVRAAIATCALPCAAAKAAECRFASGPVREVREPELDVVSVRVSGETLDAPAPADVPVRDKLQAWLRSALPQINPFDQKDLLRRQRAIYERVGFDVSVFDVMLGRQEPRIGPLGCLESLFLELHYSQRRSVREAAEFGALGIRIAGEPTLKVYVTLARNTWVPSSPWLHAKISEHVARGDELLFHIHNHPFIPDNPAKDVAGTVAPSGERGGGGDLGTFGRMRNEWGLQEFRITNGFSTFRAPISELEEFP